MRFVQKAYPRRAIILYVALCVVPGLATGIVTWAVLPFLPQPAPWGAICVRDYLNIWAAAHLVSAGDMATLFHPALYQAWLRSLFGAGLPERTWSYPPTTLILTAPFVLLPLIPGFIAWITATLSLLTAVLRRCGLPWTTCLAILLSPAVLENALVGQNGAVTASLLEGGLLLAGRRPVIAGIMFGLLSSKPQLGLLIPVCMAASGNWKAILAAAATGSLVVCVSIAAFGADSWLWYLTDVRAFMTAHLEKPFGESFQSMMATPFILFRWFGAPVALAYALQAGVSAACAVTAWRAWRRPGANPAARTALTAALALLATPYGFSYDTIGTAVGIAMLAGMAAETRFLPMEALLLAAAWLWPGCAFWSSLNGTPPIGCLTIAGVAFCAWRRLAPVCKSAGQQTPVAPRVAFKLIVPA